MHEGLQLEDHGVYVHVPWCRAICPYCAFYVVAHTADAPHASFVDAVLAEHARWNASFPGAAVSVFLGGGTPSRLPVEELGRLLDGLNRRPDAEVGLEANPEDLSDRWIEGALEAGVTRISVGVQTLDPRHARVLGRAHTVGQANDALQRVARSGVRSWSADLMFALPGQTLDDLERDLDGLLALDPPHVSLYGLTFEPGTPFDRLRQRGRLTPPPDERWREMYDRLVARLREVGLQRYEVSNFARTGHRSVHNAGYWEGRPYQGLGPSAHGLAPDGRRWVNPRDLAGWLAGAPPEVELPTPEQAACDRLVAGIRQTDGVCLETLAGRTAHAPAPEVVDRLVGMGLLRRSGSRIALTDDGFPLADSVVTRLVDGLRQHAEG